MHTSFVYGAKLKRNPVSDAERRLQEVLWIEEEFRFGIYKKAWYLRCRKSKSIGGTKLDGRGEFILNWEEKKEERRRAEIKRIEKACRIHKHSFEPEDDSSSVSVEEAKKEEEEKVVEVKQKYVSKGLAGVKYAKKGIPLKVTDLRKKLFAATAAAAMKATKSNSMKRGQMITS